MELTKRHNFMQLNPQIDFLGAAECQTRAGSYMGTFEKHRAPEASTPVWKTARKACRTTRDESPIFSGVTISPAFAPLGRLCLTSTSIFDGLNAYKHVASP
jgi:hypothetical protein